jgi:RNA-directed DNA polymerase
LHPDKTRLIEFGRHAAANRKRHGLGKPETFRFLGFTLICGKSRRGSFLIHRKTRCDRMTATKLKEIKEGLRRRMHKSIPEQGTWLKQVVTGFFAYRAVPTNFRACWSSALISAPFGCERYGCAASGIERLGSV